MADMFDVPANEFVENTLPLYHGPFATIRIKPGDAQFTVSKPLFSKQSSYFAAMFKSASTVGQTQTVDMTEIEGILSVRSFTALLGWLYWHKVQFSAPEPEEKISAAIELSRLAEMCSIPDLGIQMAQYIKDVLIANSDPEENKYPNPNAYSIAEQHIISAGYLPEGHAVRRMLATASVKGFLINKKAKIRQWAQEHPGFGAELLHELRKALDSLFCEDYSAFVEDPITGENFKIYST